MINTIQNVFILTSLLILSSCDSIKAPAETINSAEITSNNIAPVSKFTTSESTGFAPFSPTISALSSTDIDGTITAYKWIINDDVKTNTLATFTPTFTEAGLYTIKLEVTDNDGATHLSEKTLTVVANTKPSAFFSTLPSSIGMAPFSVNFDASESTDDQNITTYNWLIEGQNHSSITSTFNHIFAGEPGTYPVILTVFDAQGLSSSHTSNILLSAQPPLIAPDISTDSQSGDIPLTVSFISSNPSNGIAPYTFSWSIENQDYSSQNISHTFENAGLYNVIFTFTDANGAVGQNTVSIQANTPVINLPIIAIGSSDVTSGEAPLMVRFDGSASDGQYPITSYVWTIEGQNYSGEVYNHLFESVGQKQVKLTVTDSSNRTSTDNLVIDVLAGSISNRAPTADAGLDRLIDENSTIYFDGSGSNDLDNDSLEYTWSVEGYVTNEPITGVNPSFSFGSENTHIVTLTVTDGEFSATDNMIVTVQKTSTDDPAPLNRIRYNGQDLYLSGFNIAWFDFAQDFNVKDGNSSKGIQETKLNTAIADLKASGGNTLRWWIHIDGSTSPAWGVNGLVSGPGQYLIADLKRALDIAKDQSVYIIPSLWSFDMLKTNNYRMVPANDNYRILTEELALQAYIDNALIPMVDQLNAHEALIAWELFNEPENMTESWFVTDSAVNINNTNGIDNLTLTDIQRTTAKMAVAIHQRALDNGETALVTTGTKSMAKYNSDVSTDPNSKGNLYRDDILMALADNNPLASLDFYQAHYYNNENKGGDWSPFHHPASYWEVDKPIVLGEFYVDLGIKNNIKRNGSNETLKPKYEEIEGDNMCQRLVEFGYAGGWPWQYNEQPDNLMACLSLVDPDYAANDGNAQPIASFSVSNTSDTPVDVTFNGSASNDSDGLIVDYQWRVDNQVVGTDVVLTHNFASANTYKIRLVVTDNLGKKSAAAIEFITLAGVLPPCDLAPNGAPYCPLGYMDTDSDGWFWNNALNDGAGGSCIIINGPADSAPNSCSGVVQ